MSSFSIHRSLFPDVSLLSLDPAVIISRLKRRLTLWEAFALLFCVAMTGVFIWLYRQGISQFYDFDNYLKTAKGIYLEYYYPYWINPLFFLLSKVPMYLAIIIWSVINIFGVFIAARIFGSVSAVSLLSYQMMYSLYYGQITGLMAAGLGVMWLGKSLKKWWLAGIGLLLASVKFQSGMMIVLLLILYFWPGWKNFIRLLMVPVLVFLISILIYPNWPINLLTNLLLHPANSDASISLWPILGPFTLVLLIPIVLFPIPKPMRFFMLLAVGPLIMPYFQQADLLTLMVFPIGMIGTLLGNIGFITFPIAGFSGLQLASIGPIFLYLYCLSVSIFNFYKQKTKPNPIKSKNSSDR